MAEDDKDPDIGASDEDNNSQEQTHHGVFIDRDDDHRSPFIDSDYGEEFPGPSDDSEEMDPGYAAFARELEDPLADWPSPDTDLNDLPEVKHVQAASDPQSLPESADANPAFESRLPQDDDDEASEEVLLSFSSDDLLFDHADEEIDSSAADVVDTDKPLASIDSDDVPPVVTSSEPANTAISGDASDTVDPPQPSTIEGFDEPDLPAEGYVLDDDVVEDTHPENSPAFEASPERYEDEFVDDFLNDLDPPEEELSELEDFEDDFDTPLAATNSVAASSVERATNYDGSGMNELNADVESPSTASTAADRLQETEDRRLPLGMLAVVAVALILLGIGGYGVMQQRSDLQAEIRELQAKLATTISPEEAEVERERQRQVQLQNESLTTELEALTAENTALTQQLSELETLAAEKADAAAKKLAQQEAAAQAAAERAAQQAAAKKQAAAQSSTRPTSSGPAARGPWFVNFGSYADKAIAERWAKKLAVDDGEVVVQTATAANKTLYRVRVVGLSNQDSAERIATALERQYQLPRLWVGKN